MEKHLTRSQKMWVLVSALPKMFCWASKSQFCCNPAGLQVFKNLNTDLKRWGLDRSWPDILVRQVQPAKLKIVLKMQCSCLNTQPWRRRLAGRSHSQPKEVSSTGTLGPVL